MFPLSLFNTDPPGSTSANDKIIIGDYLNGVVIPALNDLAVRVTLLEFAPPAPAPVIRLEITAAQEAVLQGAPLGTVIQLVGPEFEHEVVLQ